MDASKVFEGKTFFVVGGGNPDGIGYATALLLAERGASVALADIDEQGVKALVDKLPGPGQHSAHALDVTDSASVLAAVNSVVARHGSIHGAAITAGIYAGATFLQTTLQSWERVFAVNTTGTFLVAQAVAKQMISRGEGGRIVAVASIGGRAARLMGAAYGASKAAVIQLVRYMALDLAPHRINVNVLCPGSTATSMMGAIDHQAAVQGDLNLWRLGIPLGHMAEARDQAASIGFLFSDDARHMTGQVMTVDGGQTFF
jgi:NAD(P)-dependent dehydrogenase (short-subunit alcohol dehydrogenase family)